MNKEIKEKWLTALKSGKYQHGVAQLCTAENKHCCIGVLVEVLGLPKAPAENGFSGYSYAGERYNLPALIWDRIEVSNLGEVGNLIWYNDQATDYTSAIKYIEEKF